MPRKSKRQLAATKTARNRAALKRKRSLAAKKGWVTRRRNAARAKRRKAAPKKKPIQKKYPVILSTMSEYFVVMDYKARKRGSVIVDISVTAPSGISRKKVIEIMQQNFKERDKWLLKFADSFFQVVESEKTTGKPSVTVTSIERPR